MQPFLPLISKEKPQKHALMAGCFSLKSITINKQIFIINFPAHIPIPRGLVRAVFPVGNRSAWSLAVQNPGGTGEDFSRDLPPKELQNLEFFQRNLVLFCRGGERRGNE